MVTNAAEDDHEFDLLLRVPQVGVVAIDVRFAAPRLTLTSLRAGLRHLHRAIAVRTVDAGLLVTDAELPEKASDTSMARIVVVRWRGSGDDGELAAALDQLMERPESSR